MAKMTHKDLILSQFQTVEFLPSEELSVHFRFRPDIVLRSTNSIRAFILRKSSSIPTEFIHRYSETTKIDGLTIEKYISFEKKPDDDTIAKCVEELQIGVCYLVKGNLKVIRPIISSLATKIISERKKLYEMPTTHIFFSSVEELDERKRGKKIVQNINQHYNKAIWANLVERDKMARTLTPEALWSEIFRLIIEDEFFLGILTEEYAAAVEREIQMAMQHKEYDKIVLLVKDNDESRTAWNALLQDIEVKLILRGRTIWYKKYSDIEEFEETLRKEIMELISKKYKEKGATFL